jgi:hypothetical protein
MAGAAGGCWGRGKTARAPGESAVQAPPPAARRSLPTATPRAPPPQERGDLKLRVRALEAERALNRVQAWQQVVSAAVVASALVNVGTVLSVSALATGATASFTGAAFFGLLMLKGYLKVRNLEKKEAALSGA